LTVTTLRTFIEQAAPGLEVEYPSARRLLRQLAAFRLQTSEGLLLAHPEHRLSQAQLERLNLDAQHLMEGRPLAWLYGFVPFLNWEFLSDERALTPRPETEALVEMVVAQYKDQQAPVRILDLCCGSGVMGLALALSFPNAQVHLTDLCPKALSLCGENVAKHGLQARTQLFEGNLWQALPTHETYDLIVANPPYVAHDDTVEAGVVAHEPHLALFSEDRGMDHIKRILTHLPEHLNAPCRAAFELGHEHHQQLASWLAKRGDGARFRFEEDPFGVPRYLFYTQDAPYKV